MKKRILLFALVFCFALSLASAAFASGEPSGDGSQEPAAAEKLLTTTVDGVELDYDPAVRYDGNVVFTYTDKLPVYGHETSAADWAGSDFRTAIYLDESGLVAGESVLAAAPELVVSEDGISVGRIESQGSTFNALIVNGGRHTVRDADILFNGDGGNDFDGYGSAILVTGDSELTLDNIHIDTTGLTRGALAAAGASKTLITNSSFYAHPGVLPEDYVMNVENSTGKMKAAPWTLGLEGTNRTTNLLGSATTTYFNCDLYAGGWGVLSADDAVAPVMNVVNTYVHADGPSVYGAFGIGSGSAIKILGTEMDVTGLLTNLASGTLLIGPASPENLAGVYGAEEIMASPDWDPQAPSVLRSSGDGLRGGGTTSVELQPGTVVEAAGAAILSKGGNATFYADGAEIRSDSGVLVLLMDSDDAGLDFSSPLSALNTTFTENDVTPEPVEGRDLNGGDAYTLTFANMDMEGDFFNASESFTTEASQEMGQTFAYNMDLTFDNTSVTGVISAAMGEHLDAETGEVTKTIDSWEEVTNLRCTARPVINNGVRVTLTGGSVWTVTGPSYLSKLAVGEGCSVAGTMTVNGVETPIAPGQVYEGDICLNAAASSAAQPASGELSDGGWPLSGAGDTSMDAFKAYLKAYMDCVPEMDGHEEELYGLIDAEIWEAPVAMAWENWFEENAMTYEEFVAADGVYSLHLFGLTSPAA